MPNLSDDAAGTSRRKVNSDRNSSTSGGRYYQPMPGHAAARACPCDRMGKSSRICVGGAPETKGNPLPPARQVQGVGPAVQNAAGDRRQACKWKHPRAPRIKTLFEEKATPAVLATQRSERWRHWEGRGVEEDSPGEDGEEGWPPRENVVFFLGLFLGALRFLVLPLPPSFFPGGRGAGGRGAPL